jgi:hypothetical protein
LISSGSGPAPDAGSTGGFCRFKGKITGESHHSADTTENLPKKFSVF